MNWSAGTLLLHLEGLQLSRSFFSSVVILQVGQLCRCVRVIEVVQLSPTGIEALQQLCHGFFSCDAAWSTHKFHAAPLALIKQESAEDLGSAQRGFSVRARLCEAAPSQSDVDVFFHEIFVCSLSTSPQATHLPDRYLRTGVRVL